jgi:hypothetical protein
MKGENETGRNDHVSYTTAGNISVPRIPCRSLIEFRCKIIPREEFITVSAYMEEMKNERKNET